MSQPSIPVGFDYAHALLEIRKHMTYEEIAAYLGYESAGAISGLLKGAIPNHQRGEAIFVLYRELFGRKPPMTDEQSAGVSDIQEKACSLSTSTV